MAINQPTITLLSRTSSTQWLQTTINQLHCPETEYSTQKNSEHSSHYKALQQNATRVDTRD